MVRLFREQQAPGEAARLVQQAFVQTTRLSVTDRKAGTQDQLSVCKGCSRLSSKRMVSGYSPGPIVCGPHLEGVRH